jgi:hypothetical protein
MNQNLVKTGACSIVIGEGHYGNFIPPKEGKLFKVTKVIERHNEFKYLDKIREIENYDNYYSIPDKELYTIKPDDMFYSKLISLTQYDNMDIFSSSLNGTYIDYAGDTDLLDSIGDIELQHNLSFWHSYKVILNFINFMIDGVYFLHSKQICHLDIKPENIIINRITSKFKIIDFGFASKEPFTNYLKQISGTPGYFPKFFENEKPTPWLPKIEANDMIPNKNGNVPIIMNPKLVYKIDSYCLGRVFYYLKWIYDTNKQYFCFNLERKTGVKIDYIISKLVENDIYKRVTISKLRKELHE